jgi:hypothetical protein
MATKFTSEFIDESLRRHQLWQHEEERQMLEEIIEEVEMLHRGPRKGTGFLDFVERVTATEARRRVQ